VVKKKNKWKDRGWWVSVEIDKRPSGKKNHQNALLLLDSGQERYDLILENGKTKARGIFNRQADMFLLAKLLEVAGHWQVAGHWHGTAAYVNGNELGASEVRQLIKLLRCASNHSYCRSGIREHRLSYVGCHLIQTGLLYYSLDTLKKGARYWFSFFRAEKENPRTFFLKKSALFKRVLVSAACPLFPENTTTILESLPVTVDLSSRADSAIWIQTRYRVNTRWLSRYPPIVPKSEEVYKDWLSNLLTRDLVK
jgi:hypothetical protein